MKKRLIVISLVLVLAAIGVRTISQISRLGSEQRTKELEEKERRDSLTITERVELAKIKGKKQVVAGSVVTLQPVAKTAEEIQQLLPRYSIILAEAIEETGYLNESQGIRGWYKLRIIDVLIQTPPQQEYAVRRVPEQMLPLNDDQFVLPRDGGSVIIDGVEVIQNNLTIPRLKISKKYLLLLSFDASTKIAEIVLGPQSILPVNSDNSLDTQSDNHILQQVIKRFHNGSLDQLKRNVHR